MEILVPKKILDRIAIEGFRPELKEATLLIWWFIDSHYPLGFEDDEGWKSINDERLFGKLVHNPKLRTKCRNWLEKEGFY